MKSLFLATDNQTVIDRINRLSANSAPLWGKMSVSQMLAHCQQPLKIAFGEIKTTRRTLIGFLFGGWAKKQFMSGKPIQKNLPTDAKFVIVDDRNFEQEKKRLQDYLNRFAKEGKQCIINQPHPFFGKMTPEEWDILTQAHLDHHLKQFGV